MKVTVLRNVASFVFDAVLRQNGAPIDLTTATSVVFRARGPKSPTLVSIVCTILDAEEGNVRTTLGPTHTAIVGSYSATFLITWAGGATTSVPNTTFIDFKVLENV